MKIKKQSTKKYIYKFEYSFDYSILDFCRMLKNEHGYLSFGFEDGSWRFNDLKFVKIIKDRYADIEVEKEIEEDLKLFKLEEEKEEIRIKKAEKLKNAVDSDLIIKGIKGELYGYQKVGVEFFLNSNGKAILADTMGAGKSIQSLAYIIHSKKEKTLIICPSSVKQAWESEIKKWINKKSFVINSQSDLTIKIINENDIFIINYDLLRKFYENLKNIRFDCLVIDEFTYIKNSKAIRSKVTKNIASRIPSVLLLSGTPILSRPIEIFNALQIIDPRSWNSWMAFSKRYCAGYLSRWGWDTSGSSNIKELKQKISKYFLRRTKNEILKELPPKRYINLPIQLKKEERVKYDLVEQDFIKYLKEVKNKKKSEINKSLLAEKLTKLNELKQITSNGKIYAAVDTIQGIIENDEKIVMFSVYNKPLEEIKKHFGNQAVLLTGKTKEEERKNIIEKFQNNSKIKIFLGGIKSSGVGITLTAATNVLFLDYSWNPADHNQGEDRIHRIGQKAKSISIYQLYAHNTIDSQLKELLSKKQKIFDQLIEKDNKITNTKQESLVNQLLGELENK